MGTATITEWDMAKRQPVTDSRAVHLVVDFDPKSLELSYATTGMAAGKAKTASGTWNKTPAQQTGQSAKLSVTLLFDTTATDGVSVQTETDALVLLTLPHDLSAQGPKRRVVQFQWGSFLFYGCVESMTQTIDFFSDSGVPLRASVQLSIGQVGPPDTPSDPGGPSPSVSFGSNAGPAAPAASGPSAPSATSPPAGPGALSAAGTTPLTLSQDGDTVQGIVARSGGSASWKAIAAANNIDNPRLLPPGTVLSLSPGAPSATGSG
jgi:Contractile injection system tube protein/LysM domain